MRALAIIVNFFFPGLGTLIIGKIGIGIIQILIDLFVLFLFLIPFIGWLIAIPLGIGNWIWALITAATAKLPERS